MCEGCEIRDEKIRQLERELYAKDYVSPLELRLSGTQTAMLGVLLRYDRIVSTDLLFEATRHNRTWKTEPDAKLMQVQMFRLREKLRPWGLSVQTVHGEGFRLTDETRRKLLSWPADVVRAA